MDPTTLVLDEESLLGGLKPWVECESPTWDAAAVNRMLDLASRDLALMGARIERIAGRMGFSDCVRATLPHPRAGEPGVLVMAHLDTVHPVGTLAALPWRRDNDRQYGPGVCDMKGGTFIALAALQALAAAGQVTPLPVTVLLTGDEEAGTPSARDLVEAEARRHRFVLVPEPGHADGSVTTSRYAIARFNLTATGRPSHAGATLSAGRSAIREMARKVIEIEALTTEDATFSVGVIQGGRWVNCVPTTCQAEVLSMAKRQEDLDRAVTRMMALAPGDPDLRFEASRGVTRPVWTESPADRDLYHHARRIARMIGFDIGARAAGGGSDGNFSGAMGVPTLDSLGVIGGGIHTLEEHLLVSSLVPRARLLAGLIGTLGPG